MPVNVPQEQPGVALCDFRTKHMVVTKKRLMDELKRNGGVQGILKEVPEGMGLADILQALDDDPREVIPLSPCDNQLPSGECGGHR